MMGKFEKDTGAGRFFKDFKKYHGLPVQDAIFFNHLNCELRWLSTFINKPVVWEQVLHTYMCCVKKIII